MDNKTKYIALAAIAAAAAGYWWWTHRQASAEIISQPVVPVTALPNVTSPVVGVSVVEPVGTSSTSTGQDQTELNALLAWANTTQNPMLYAQMINALSPGQLDGLYNILTTDWQGSGSPTPAQTGFWNGLVAAYPFLRAGNIAACKNFSCS